MTRTQGRHAVNAIIVNGPVMGLHLDFISQFLFTGDYTIETRDVEEFPIDRIKHPNGCANCVDHLRLLSLHLSIFHAARYLGMEMLQLLALNRFCSAAEHATSTVLRYIVQDVYTIEPQTLVALPFGKYSLANWFDYRPFFVMPAVMEFIRKHKPAIQPHYASVVRDIQGARIETLRAGWPEADQFEAMRYQIPDFDRHMRWAEVVLAQGEKHPQGLNVPEPTGDLLDTLALPIDQFTQENELQQIMEVCEDFDSFCNSHSNL